MNDCPNGDVRDMLPDFLHERLDADSRVLVSTHVSACLDCQAELALLRDVRATIRAGAPAIDVSSIVAAIAAPRAVGRRPWVNWRVAAGLTLLIAGGSSVAVLRDDPANISDPVVIAAAQQDAQSPSMRVATPVGAPSATVQPGTVQRVPVSSATSVESVTGGRELAMGGGSLTDLNDVELAALLKDIESLDALPLTDVESPSLAPIAPSTGRRGGP